MNDRISEEEIRKILNEHFKNRANDLEFLNLIVAAICAHEHAFADILTEEKFLEIMSFAWNMGRQQKRVYTMEIEGSIMNTYGTVTAIASWLDLWGQKNGYLSKKE